MSQRKSPAVRRVEEALAVAEKNLADFEERKAQLLPLAQKEFKQAESVLEEARRKEQEALDEGRTRLGLGRPGAPSQELVDELLRWSGVALDEKDMFLDSPHQKRVIERAACNTAYRILYADSQVAQAMKLAERAWADSNAARDRVNAMSNTWRLSNAVKELRDDVEHARRWTSRTSRLSIPEAMEEAHDKATEKLCGVTDPGRPDTRDDSPVISWPPVTSQKATP